DGSLLLRRILSETPPQDRQYCALRIQSGSDQAAPDYRGAESEDGPSARHRLEGTAAWSLELRCWSALSQDDQQPRFAHHHRWPREACIIKPVWDRQTVSRSPA